MMFWMTTPMYGMSGGTPSFVNLFNGLQVTIRHDTTVYQPTADSQQEPIANSQQYLAPFSVYCFSSCHASRVCDDSRVHVILSRKIDESFVAFITAMNPSRFWSGFSSTPATYRQITTTADTGDKYAMRQHAQWPLTTTTTTRTLMKKQSTSARWSVSSRARIWLTTHTEMWLCSSRSRSYAGVFSADRFGANTSDTVDKHRETDEGVSHALVRAGSRHSVTGSHDL